MKIEAELVETFSAQARALGAEVFYAAYPEAARLQVGELIRSNGIQRVALPSSPELLALDLRSAIVETGAEVTTGTRREQAERAELGITWSELAVAATGTLIHDATALEARLFSMLPPMHLALVPLRGLVASLEEALAYWSARGEFPGYLAMISGPSRTADIERVLTIGVHGPRRLLVMLLGEERA
ncbi:LutC/YkgG family protein [Desulfothermobacter acidiphilus]|uniref:LutC/YkgG family protein n=1 Tax=Desulfothermobacter acidiphilus TaxID=1938353 RepID=UPI003F897EDF